jgi:hypothetical protein
MKLHLAVGKDNYREHLKYVQIKGGFIYATNCHILARIPVNEVFSEIFTSEDELYIKGEDWKKQGFYKCTDFKRNGNLLEAYNNKWQLQGIIKMKTRPEMDEIGRFPDCESVIYSSQMPTEAVDKISFNPSLLMDLAEALGENLGQLIYNFYGALKTIQVKPHNSNKLGILMPIDYNMFK